MKDWIPTYALMDFEDCNKQKHLVVLAVLPTGLVHYDTTNTDIFVGSMQHALIIKIIWLNNMTNVTLLLGQFMSHWHVDDFNMWKRLVLERAFKQL